jgi:hypothetical protein
MTPETSTIAIEKRLGLPSQEEERVLFQKFDLFDLIEKYSPLADFLVDDYVCPNRNMSVIVEEVVHNILLRALIKFRAGRKGSDNIPFVLFYSTLVHEVMDDYVKDNMVARLSETKIAQ